MYESPGDLIEQSLRHYNEGLISESECGNDISNILRNNVPHHLSIDRAAKIVKHVIPRLYRKHEDLPAALELIDVYDDMLVNGHITQDFYSRQIYDFFLGKDA